MIKNKPGIKSIQCKRCLKLVFTRENARKYCNECAKISDTKSQEKAKEKNIKKYRARHKDYDSKRYKTQGASPKDELKSKVRSYSNTVFRKDTKCYFCKSKERLQFHHIKYELPSKGEHLKTVCGSCHRKLHFLTKTIQQENQALKEKLGEERIIRVMHKVLPTDCLIATKPDYIHNWVCKLAKAITENK